MLELPQGRRVRERMTVIEHHLPYHQSLKLPWLASATAGLFFRYGHVADLRVGDGAGGSAGPPLAIAEMGPTSLGELERSFAALLDEHGAAAATWDGVQDADERPQVVVASKVCDLADDVDLLLAVEGSRERTTVIARAREGLYGRETLRTILNHLRNVLATPPNVTVERASVIDPAEREAFLGELNGRPLPDPPPTLLLAELVDRAIARDPDRVALRFRGESISFGALGTLATNIVENLRAIGVERGDVVAVLGPRGLELCGLMLGLFRLGAAYLAFEDRQPEARTLEMLGIATPKLVVEAGFPIPEGWKGRRCALNDLTRAAARSTGPLPPLDPETIAYVTFTSGSTGVPKGVLRSHRTCASRLHWEQSLYRFGSEERCLLKQAASPREFVWPLSYGATVVIAEPDIEKDDVRLTELLDTERVTVASFVPSHLRVLSQTWRLRAGKLALRHIFTGGEALAADLERELRADGFLIHNTYTMAESDYMVHRSGPTELVDGTSNIGRPTDMRIYLADKAGNLVPWGVIGEIYAAGSGVASGYINRPDLTAERFLPNPFEASPTIVFRTGDLARFRGDGQLEYVGRADQQFKLRGLRVEPAEVEVHLRRHPAVDGVAVIASADKTQLIAYVVSPPANRPSPRELRSWLEPLLPPFMIPGAFVFLDALPRLPMGKLDRRGLPPPSRERPTLDSAYRAPRTALERTVCAAWEHALGLTGIGVNDAFLELGGDSLRLMALRAELARLLKTPVPLKLLLQNPTIAAQSAALEGEVRPSVDSAPRTTKKGAACSKIAIVGLSFRIPGASSMSQLWDLLEGRREAIVRGTSDDVTSSALGHQVKAVSSIDGLDAFDATFFRMAPSEAMLVDPQHRMLLELAHAALEDAALSPARFDGAVSVFASAGKNDHERRLRETATSIGATLDETFVEIGHSHDFLATRISYRLGLRGPSLNVQSACSSGLVALHLACRSLASGESDASVVGASAVRYPRPSCYAHYPGGIASPDGCCRTFDETAAGTVPADAVVALVLRRLEDALADGHKIYGVIRGSAVNNDGRKVGFGSVSNDAQAAMIRASHEVAGVAPSDIAFVEAHGTATPLGDHVELTALSDVFATRRADEPCVVTSIKASIGHAREASGLVGLVKTLLILEKRRLPPMPHFRNLPPVLARDVDSRAIAVDQNQRTFSQTGALIAGVSSFGLGGTNVHVIVESPPPSAFATSERAPVVQVVPYSARTPNALRALRKELALAARALPPHAVDEIAFTMQEGRDGYSQRGFVIADNATAVAEALEVDASTQREERERLTGRCRIGFVFPGLGDQYAQMAHKLIERFASFRADLVHAGNIIRQELGVDIFDALGWNRPFEDPLAGLDPLKRMLARVRAEKGESLSVETTIVHPALFSIQHAFVHLLATFGIRPDVVVGHSLGEFATAVTAGAVDADDALRVVCRRANLLRKQPNASLLAVLLPEEELARLATGSLSIAAVNAPAQGVLAGPTDEIRRLSETLTARGVAHRLVPSDHAFHSSHVRGAQEELAALLQGVTWRCPKHLWISSVTGTTLAADRAPDTGYWLSHLTQPIRFADASLRLLENADVLIEIGPGSLSSCLKQTAGSVGRTEDCVIVPLTRRSFEAEPDDSYFLRALGRLWLAGAEVDFRAAAPAGPRRRLGLPATPLDAQDFSVIPENLDGNVPFREGLFQPLMAQESLDDDERELLSLWSRLLRVTRVRTCDSFFDLGGDSLLGIRLRRMVNESFGVDIPPKLLFRNATLRGMSATIAAHRATAGSNLS